jgi:uncharacterized membrane protein
MGVPGMMIGIGHLGAFAGLRFLGMAGTAFVLPALVTAAAVWFIVRSATVTPATVRAARIDQGVEIVRRRFANGEIDADEYNRLVTGLTCTL